MKMNVKYILLLILLLPQVSCNNWMDLVPPEGLIREEFWQTKEDVRSVVMGAYSSFSALDTKLFKYGEIRGDMLKRDVNQSLDEQKIMEGNIYPDNSMCDWNDFYTIIDYCNEVIKNGPLVQEKDHTFTDYQLKGYLSEAHFLRGLAYFYLVRIFRDVPLITEPTISDDADFYVPKTDGEDILNFLIQDLESTRDFATTDGYPTLRDLKGRATKASYDALLADISLWTFDYEAVLKYVQRIENNQDYVLMPNLRWFELFYPGNSLESIFEFQFDDALNQKNGMFNLTKTDSKNYDPSNRAVDLFTAPGVTEGTRGLDASIAKIGTDDYIIWKYVGRNNDGQTQRTGTTQNSCNFIIYRLSDVLLMKAEALSQLGRFDDAYNVLDRLRSRYGLGTPHLGNLASVYEDFIMDERARELAFEGKRWFDLMRMGRRNDFNRKSKLIEILIQNVPSTQKRILATKLTNPLGWYLPVWDTELERNKNLVQNPYYNF